jgi:SNF2 family DNA or RNA helicase
MFEADTTRLNLATANRVFLVEPQWNPSIEGQAIARALRIGQKQAVQVTRYITKQTVEQVSVAIPRYLGSYSCMTHAN